MITEVVQWSTVGLLALVLTTASIIDIRYRRIPNWTVLAVAALSIPWIAFGLGASAFSALMALVIVFGVTLPLYVFGLFGAGDCKLLTAVSLFIGLEHLLFFFAAVAIAGGFVAAISLLMNPIKAMVILQTGGRGRIDRGVPYGVAISIGAALIMVWQYIRPSVA